MSVGTCMLLGTRVAPRCCGVSYGKAAGARLPAGIAGSPGVGTRVLPARHAWALGVLVSPRQRWPHTVTPGNKHAPGGRVGRRVGRALAASRRFRSSPLRGGFVRCQRGASVPRPVLLRGGGERHSGTVGVQRGHTWAPCVCRRGHVQHAGGSQIRGGAGELLPFPGGPASPGVHGRSDASCAHSCAHAGHLLKHGEAFPQPRPVRVPRVCMVGAGGSRQRGV